MIILDQQYENLMECSLYSSTVNIISQEQFINSGFFVDNTGHILFI
jgi:hypothetical protein